MKALPLILAVALVGCGGKIDTPEEGAKAITDVLDDANDILDGVKDKRSAEAAKPKLEALSKRRREIEAQMSKANTKSSQLSKRDMELTAEAQKDLMAQVMRLQGNMMRLSNDPEALEIVSKAMGDMPRGGG